MSTIRAGLMRVSIALVMLTLKVGCSKDSPRIFDCASEPCTDCEFIGSKLEGFNVDRCKRCQGKICSEDANIMHNECANFPCKEGKYFLHACNNDSECVELGFRFCGRHTGVHYMCVVDDDI